MQIYFMLPLTLSQWLMFEMRSEHSSIKRATAVLKDRNLPLKLSLFKLYWNCWNKKVHFSSLSTMYAKYEKKNSCVTMRKNALFVDCCWASNYFLLKLCYDSKWQYLFLCKTRLLFNLKQDGNLFFNRWTELIFIMSTIWMDFKSEANSIRT